MDSRAVSEAVSPGLPQRSRRCTPRTYIYPISLSLYVCTCRDAAAGGAGQRRGRPTGGALRHRPARLASPLCK